MIPGSILHGPLHRVDSATALTLMLYCSLPTSLAVSRCSSHSGHFFTPRPELGMHPVFPRNHQNQMWSLYMLRNIGRARWRLWGHILHVSDKNEKIDTDTMRNSHVRTRSRSACSGSTLSSITYSLTPSPRPPLTITSPTCTGEVEIVPFSEQTVYCLPPQMPSLCFFPPWNICFHIHLFFTLLPITVCRLLTCMHTSPACLNPTFSFFPFSWNVFFNTSLITSLYFGQKGTKKTVVGRMKRQQLPGKGWL